MGSMSTPLRELSPELQDRYGYRPTSRVLLVLGVTACVLIAGFGAMVAYRLGNPEVYYKMLAWKAVDANHTSVTFEVRRDPSVTVQCALRVQNRDHHDLGFAIATVPPGTEYSQTTYQVATTQLGYAAEVLSCAPAGQLGDIELQFPPAAPNPPQPWSPNDR